MLSLRGRDYESVKLKIDGAAADASRRKGSMYTGAVTQRFKFHHLLNTPEPDAEREGAATPQPISARRAGCVRVCPSQ